MATAAIELVSKAIQALVDQEASTKLTVESVVLLGLTVAIKVGVAIHYIEVVSVDVCASNILSMQFFYSSC